MSERAALAGWIRELAGEYVESWVADMIAEEWMIDRDRIRELESALAWYGEQARLARLIHREGDAGRWALLEDAGKRAKELLEQP